MDIANLIGQHNCTPEQGLAAAMVKRAIDDAREYVPRRGNVASELHECQFKRNVTLKRIYKLEDQGKSADSLWAKYHEYQDQIDALEARMWLETDASTMWFSLLAGSSYTIEEIREVVLAVIHPQIQRAA